MTGEKEPQRSTVEKKEKKKRAGGIAAFSLLISLFDRLGEIIYNAVVEGFFGNIFTAYTKTKSRFLNGFWGTYVTRNKKIKQFFRKLRKLLSKNLDSCLTLSFATNSITKLCSLPLQHYGNLGLFFGIYTIVVYCVKFFVPGIADPDISHLYIGIFTAVASIPMIFSRISLAMSVKNSVVGRTLFKQILGFSDESFDSKKSVSQRRGNYMLLIGLILGFLTFVIHPAAIMIIALFAILLALIAVSPEIGVLITVFSIPFLSFFETPTALLAVLIIVTTFFYVIKVIRGKRIFKLELSDVCVLLFAIVIQISAIYSAGERESIAAAGTAFILMLGYFLFVNLMRTEKWIKRCLIALVSSASVAAIIGVFEFVFGDKSGRWLDQGFHEIIKTRVVSLFDNPNILAVFLTMVFPFLVAFSINAKERNTRFLTKILIISFIACIVFTWSRAAWLALILGALVFAILYTKKSFRIFGVALLTLPIIPMVLPIEIIERFLSITNFSDSSIAYRIYTWKGTLSAIGDFWVGGIGYGDPAFQAIYPSYALPGAEAAPHSHSLTLQILLGMGIIGLVIFAFAIFFNIQKCLEYIKSNRESNARVFVIASIVSIVSALIMGVFDYIWYNQRIFYLFWLVLSIGCAFVRVNNYEKNRLSELDPY